MTAWLLTNLCLSGVALVFIQCNTRSPHRLRFLVGFAALAAWLVPWQMLSLPTVAGIASVQSGLGEALPLSNSDYRVAITYGFPGAIGLSLNQLLAAFVGLAALPGLALFLRDAWAQRRILRQLASTATCGNHLWQQLPASTTRAPVLVQRQAPGAFTSGILVPKIWLHESLAASRDLPAILLHESTHIRHHDNLFLVIIALVEKLFWWNPAARILATRARALQELSCDERCLQQLHNYREMLASLILGNLYRETQPGTLSLAANMFTKKNADVERIRLMERSYPMKPRHILSTAAVLSAAALSITLFASDADEATVTDERAFFIHFNGDAPFGNGEEVHGIRMHRLLLDGELAPVGEGEDALAHINFTRAADIHDVDLQYVYEDFNWHTTEPMLSIQMTATPLVDALRPLSMALHPAGIKGADYVADSVEIDTVDNAADGKHYKRVMVAAAKPLHHFEDRVVIEDDLARDILVDLNVESKTVAEIVEILSLDSGCNIYIDGEKIVVDQCDI